MTEKKPNQKKTDKKQLELLLAYREVFGTEKGQMVIDDLMAKFFLRSSMDDNPLQLAFKEGERNVVLRILTSLNIDEKLIRERVNNVKNSTT